MIFGDELQPERSAVGALFAAGRARFHSSGKVPDDRDVDVRCGGKLDNEFVVHAVVVHAIVRTPRQLSYFKIFKGNEGPPACRNRNHL